MVQIYAIRLQDGQTHADIARVWWFNPQTAKFGDSSRAEIVAWLRKNDSRAYVCDGRSIAEVGVVDGSPSYVRTYADSSWTNNLLALPRL